MTTAEQPTFEETLEQWAAAKAKLAEYRALEFNLRKGLSSAAFPNPVEGVNNFTLIDGRIFKNNHKIYRKVDEPALPLVYEELKGDPVLTQVFKVKVELAVGVYKKLPVEKQRIIDKALIASPGAPSISVV